MNIIVEYKINNLLNNIKVFFNSFVLITFTCTGCRQVFVLPMPSTVVTANPCMAHTGARHAFTEMWLSATIKEKNMLSTCSSLFYMLVDDQQIHGSGS